MTAVVPEVADAMNAARTERRVAKAGRHRAARPVTRGAAARNRAATGRGRTGPSAILPSQIGQHARNQGAGERSLRYGQQRATRAAYAAPGAFGRQASYVASNASLVPGDRNYQGLILAEYVTALVIMIAAPLAGTNGGGNGASPYTVNDLKRIVAASAVYFFIALGSGGTRGKYAAMLGGLILLAILLAAAKAGAINDFFMVVGSTGTGQAPGTSTAGGRGSGGGG